MMDRLDDFTAGQLVNRIEKEHDKFFEKGMNRNPTREELDFFADRPGGFQAVMIIPHEESYKKMLSKIDRDDVICDMGAGDLRFAIMASRQCKKVYAVEMNPEMILYALKVIKWKQPRNLVITVADWRDFDVPEDVNKIFCLVNIDKKELPSYWFEEHKVYVDDVRRR